MIGGSDLPGLVVGTTTGAGGFTTGLAGLTGVTGAMGAAGGTGLAGVTVGTVAGVVGRVTGVTGVTGLATGRVMGLRTGATVGVDVGLVALLAAPATDWRTEVVCDGAVADVVGVVGSASVPAATIVVELLPRPVLPVDMAVDADAETDDEARGAAVAAEDDEPDSVFGDRPSSALPRSAADNPVDVWSESAASFAAVCAGRPACNVVSEARDDLADGKDSCWLAKAGVELPAALRPSIPAKPTPASAKAVYSGASGFCALRCAVNGAPQR